MKKFTKKQWIIVSLSSLLLMLFGLFAWNKINEPRDIGPELTYIGKINTACEWWEMPLFMGWCQGPKYYYYFATDFDTIALQSYFQKAKYVDAPNDLGGASAEYRYTNIHFQKYDSDDFFYFNYFDEKNAKSIPNIPSPKKYIIRMTPESYQLAKSAY